MHAFIFTVKANLKFFSFLVSARYHGVPSELLTQSTALDLCLVIFDNIWRPVGVLLGLVWEG